jgi:hypothetical protein
MNVRETLEKRKNLTIAVCAIPLVIAICLIVAHVREPANATAAVSTAYYSDDGASYFGGSAKQTWELQAKSVPVYPATVYDTRDGKERFVAYITRLPPAALQERSKALADYTAKEPTLTGIEHTKLGEAFTAQIGSIMSNMEIKRPGPQNKWVPVNSPEGRDIQTNIKSPQGSTDVKIVYP